MWNICKVLPQTKHNGRCLHTVLHSGARWHIRCRPKEHSIPLWSIIVRLGGGGSLRGREAMPFVFICYCLNPCSFHRETVVVIVNRWEAGSRFLLFFWGVPARWQNSYHSVIEKHRSQYYWSQIITVHWSMSTFRFNSSLRVPRLPYDSKINWASSHIFPPVRGSSNTLSNYNNRADGGEKFSLRWMKRKNIEYVQKCPTIVKITDQNTNLVQ